MPDISPYIDIELGGRVRRLQWKFRALRAIEEALPGSNALSGLAGLFADLTASRAVVFVWAGLLHDHLSKEGTHRDEKPPTMDEVADWLDGETFDRFVQQLSTMSGERRSDPAEVPANPPTA